ncbi:MAG TPA: AAA family ATPase [Burkholderiales bacterium]|jgi:MSHA biogenesis protein MshM|nr:AAA family ATPase [Burkholderiales bacterium]
MYYAFFGLSHPPFKITPDTEVFFEGGNRGAILEALIYAISQGEGIIKVTGEVGSGKTMLCRMLQTRLPSNIDTVYLANPNVSPDEILHAIAFELQLPVAKDAPRLEVMHRLNEYLLERHAQKRQVVLFVEESQGMPLATLEEIRLLSNLETHDHKLLQIVLFGQPELDENLRRPQIRQLRERITHSFTLAPLTAEDVRLYLNFRLHAAGYRGPDLFRRRVVGYIARASAGLTRRVNIIADKAMLAAFAEGTHDVSMKHVRAAIRDSEFSAGSARPLSSQLVYAVTGVLFGGLLGVGAFSAYQAWRAEPLASPKDPSAVHPALLQQPEESPAAASRSDQFQPAPAGSTPALTAAQVVGAQVAGVPGAQSADGEEDLLEQRLLATERLLTGPAVQPFTIQLLGSSDPELLRSYLKTISKYLEIERIFVYRTMARERPSLTVLYGNFATLREANAQIEKLPEELKANRPYCRTLNGIRAEIAQYRS